jgi:hypothetical protein
MKTTLIIRDAMNRKTLMSAEASEHITGLVVPPVGDVRGIILDMMPTVAPGADQISVDWSVHLATRLVALLTKAKEDADTERVLGEFMRGILPCP